MQSFRHNYDLVRKIIQNVKKMEASNIKHGRWDEVAARYRAKTGTGHTAHNIESAYVQTAKKHGWETAPFGKSLDKEAREHLSKTRSGVPRNTSSKSSKRSKTAIKTAESKHVPAYVRESVNYVRKNGYKYGSAWEAVNKHYKKDFAPWWKGSATELSQHYYTLAKKRRWAKSPFQKQKRKRKKPHTKQTHDLQTEVEKKLERINSEIVDLIGLLFKIKADNKSESSLV